MTYDHEVILIGLETVTDEIGDTVEIAIEKPVLASILDYRSKDYYQALSSGLKPSVTFAVNKYEYENEKTLKHEGKLFKIIDVFPVKAKEESEFESLSLLCEAVI